MNLLPQRQNQIITITVFQFCLRDLTCLSRPVSGRSISENCLEDHGWTLISTCGRKANSYPSSPKLEDLEIHGVSLWLLAHLMSAGFTFRVSLHSSSGGGSGGHSDLRRLNQEASLYPNQKMQRFTKIWRWIRSDKKVTLVPAYHPHPISKIEWEQDRNALSLKRFCL